MADNHVHGNGTMSAVVTIILGVFSKISPGTVGSLAAYMTITVGCYTLYINWPRFVVRVKSSYASIHTWIDKLLKRK